MDEVRTLLPAPRYMAFRHEDVRSVGIPDISVTSHRFTSWWETKHATPDFYTFGLQELNCKRLAQVGFCRYIIWFETPEVCKTLIVHPKHLTDLTPEAEAVGHDHHFITEFMRSVHECPAVRLRDRISINE